jgi:hypothetical protein
VWRVRAMAPDLSTIGASQIVAKRPQSVSFSGMSLASQSGHRGGLFWDESHGCRFVGLEDDASPGASSDLESTWCYGLGGTDDGFFAFASPAFEAMPLEILTLDASGVLAGKVDVLPPMNAETFPRGRAKLDDGSWIVVWSELDDTYFAARITLQGAILAGPKMLVSLGDDPRFAISGAGDHALAVWSSDHAPGDILVAKIGADLATEEVSFVGNATPPPGGVSIRGNADGALVAWSDPSSKTIQVVRVSESGELVSRAVAVPTPGPSFELRVAPTSFGAGLAFEAIVPGALTQVWATALPCVIR